MQRVDRDVGADFASDRHEPGCLLLCLRVTLLVLAVAAFSWAFMLGIGPIGVFGLGSDVFGPSMTRPIAVGVAAVVALLALDRLARRRS